MGLCRGSTPATCQRRVRHQAHWCRGLARLPTTPHCQTAGNGCRHRRYNAFRDCKLLNSVLAPGCRDFGYKGFAECCFLQWVCASDGAANVFNGEANFGQYLFQGCINLAEVTLSEVPSPRGSTLQVRTGELAPGCLSSTGIYALALLCGCWSARV